MTPARERALRLQSKARMHEKNDGELVRMLQQDKARLGGKLHKLDPDSFPLPSLSVSPEWDVVVGQGHGFKRGDRVRMTASGLKEASLAGGKTWGRVQGVAGVTVLVNNRFYAVGAWEKCS